MVSDHWAPDRTASKSPWAELNWWVTAPIRYNRTALTVPPDTTCTPALNGVLCLIKDGILVITGRSLRPTYHGLNLSIIDCTTPRCGLPPSSHTDPLRSVNPSEWYWWAYELEFTVEMALVTGRYSPAHVTGVPEVSSPPKSSSRWSKVGEWLRYRIGNGRLGPALYDGPATYRST